MSKVLIYLQEKNIVDGKFEDIKGAIRNRQSKKDRQHNGQKKKDKRTNNNLLDGHFGFL